VNPWSRVRFPGDALTCSRAGRRSGFPPLDPSLRWADP
jgi:hypothetical protein